MNLSKSKILKYFSAGVRLHMLAVFALFVVILLITFSSRYYLDLLPRSTFVYVFILVCTYVGRWLAKRWILKQRWFSILMVSLTLFFLLSGIGIVCWIYLSNYKTDSFFFTVPLFTMVLLLAGFGLTMVRTLVNQQLKQAIILQIQKESELKLLISQLHPHFLFNTLNNIYGMSLRGDNQLPSHILKLSSLLRYSIYQASQSQVSMQEEVAYLKDFIDFEKIRFGEKLMLTTSFEEVNQNLEIAPMLLIAFVENAFKHSKNASGQPIHIDVKLKALTNSVFLCVENSYNKNVEERAERHRGGFGISTAKKRLDLLYPRRHKLEIDKEGGFYTVRLQIRLSSNEDI